MLEEQANESSDQLEDEANPIANDSNTVEGDEKPDINDVPMDDTQVINLQIAYVFCNSWVFNFLMDLPSVTTLYL